MGDENNDKSKNQNEGGNNDTAKLLETMKAENEKLSARNAELDKKLADLSKTPPEDPTLLDKARKQREDDDKKHGDMKAMENALTFSLKSQDFVKTNASLLPKDIEDLFKSAEKENYGSAIEKVQAIKAGIIQSFFSVQANVDLLTPGLKTSLDDYLKLTKTGKQEKALAIYDGVFEPAFEMLKRMKKAEALNKGYGSGDDSDAAYKNKMVKLSRQHFLGKE